jgi:hypothetical protein
MREGHGKASHLLYHGSAIDVAPRRNQLLHRARNADYSMYSTFLTASPGSVLFSRSTLLKRIFASRASG